MDNAVGQRVVAVATRLRFPLSLEHATRVVRGYLEAKGYSADARGNYPAAGPRGETMRYHLSDRVLHAQQHDGCRWKDIDRWPLLDLSLSLCIEAGAEQGARTLTEKARAQLGARQVASATRPPPSPACRGNG